MIAKYLRLAIVLLAGLQLAGCYTDLGPVEVGTGPSSLSGSGVANRLQPGEKVKITVYGEESLTGDYDINPAGYVTMPLIGAVRAAGRSQAELGKDIANRYVRGGFLQDPHVTVAVVQFKPFYVLGEALTPKGRSDTCSVWITCEIEPSVRSTRPAKFRLSPPPAAKPTRDPI